VEASRFDAAFLLTSDAVVPTVTAWLILAIGIVTRRGGGARLPTVMWASVGSNPSKTERMS
jgi:hypothetical protein